MQDISDFTPIKQEIIRGLFAYLMRAAHGIMGRNPWMSRRYWYIDMNAADGEGSPAFFLDTAERLGLDYQALFIERDDVRYRDLAAYYAGMPGIVTCKENHNDILVDYILENIEGRPFGLIYNDNHGAPSFHVLAEASRLAQTQLIDFLMTCPATAIKRVRAATGRVCYLVDGLQQIEKKQWLIRAPYGAWQWTILVGTNWEHVGEWRKQQMYLLTSSAGQSILERLNFTWRERQRPLPFD